MDTIDLTAIRLGIAARPAGVDADIKRKKRREGKGRPVDPAALAQVRELLGDEPRRRDLLIEHLHKIQDRYQLHQRRAHRGAGRRDALGTRRSLRGRDVLSPFRRGEGRRRPSAGDHDPRLRKFVVRVGGCEQSARTARRRQLRRGCPRADCPVRRALRSRAGRRRQSTRDRPCHGGRRRRLPRTRCRGG